MKNQKIIIFTVIGLLTISLLFLGAVEYQQKTGEIYQGWWNLYFVSPYNAQSLDFVIENYSKNTQFNYKILINDEIVEEKNIQVSQRAQKLIEPQIKKETNSTVQIVVHSSKDKKTIYKKF
jgi:hypothetical protein